LNAENAWDNYARTRDPLYLEAYNSAVNDLFQRRNELKNIYSGEHSSDRFEQLFVLINSRVEVLTELVKSVTERTGLESQAEMLRREELINNALFQTIQDLEKDEHTKLLALDAHMETLSTQSIYALLAGTLLSVIMFSALFYFLYHELQVRKRLEQEIKRQAHSDQLTGLPNRLSFMERLNYEITQANRYRQRLAILFLDVDHFKEINDSLGHEAGDTLLKELAGRMRANVRESDTVARIGGDEFNILLTNIPRTDDVSLIAEKVIDSFRLPLTIAGQEIHSSSSVGISIYPEDGENSTDLLKNADIAMYHAKEQGRNNFKFYNPSLNRRTQEKAMMESSLRHTLEKNEMVLHYQPLLDIRKKKIVCAEALVRWRHPDRGLLEPLDFIPVAEGIGFLSSLDEWVLRTACNQAGEWGKSDSGALCLTVNISLRKFKKPDFVKAVRGILEETGFDPRGLELELSEQAAMEDIQNTAEKVHDLRSFGVRLAIDHFGAGHFSLNNLKMLSVDRIKIDRSFISEVDFSQSDRAIIKAMIVMAHDMDITVVAEGVENREQMRFLEANGCDEVQGYLLCRPLPVEELVKFTAAYGRTPVEGNGLTSI
jgi:diguanylate cyclase (GGDEF)-like protein